MKNLKSKYKMKWQTELIIFAIILTTLPSLLIGLKLIDKSQEEVTHSINLQLTNITNNISNEINVFFVNQLEKQYLIKKSFENESLGVNEKVALLISSLSTVEDLVSTSLIFREGQNYSTAFESHKSSLDSLDEKQKAKIVELISSKTQVLDNLLNEGQQFGNPKYIDFLNKWYIYLQLPIKMNDTPDAYLVSIIDLSKLQNQLQKPSYTEVGSIMITNLNKESIFNSIDSKYDNIILHDAIDMLNGNSRITNISNYTQNNEQYVVSIAFTENVSWVVVAIENYEVAYSFVQDLNNTMYLWIFLAMGFAMVIGLLITRRVRQPISHLADKANEISSGNFDIEVDYKLDDAIGTLGRTMESMSQSLKMNFKEIEEKNLILEDYSKTLENKVLKRTKKLKQTNEDLQKAYLQVLELNNEKNEFLGIVAHDLKNPLVAIKGFGEIIKSDKSLNDEDRAGFADTIIESSERMFDIITSLLDINKIEEGRVEIKYETLLASEILDSIVKQNSDTAKNKSIDIILNGVDEKIKFSSDKALLIQVLDNFISNAIKFSNKNSKIELSISTDDTSIIFDVKDYGPGLSDDDKTKLFQKFAKLSARPTAGEHSTGLGLSISKKIIEMLGGNIVVESEVGVGSKFSIIIPT